MTCPIACAGHGIPFCDHEFHPGEAPYRIRVSRNTVFDRIAPHCGFENDHCGDDGDGDDGGGGDDGGDDENDDSDDDSEDDDDDELNCRRHASGRSDMCVCTYVRVCPQWSQTQCQDSPLAKAQLLAELSSHN